VSRPQVLALGKKPPKQIVSLSNQHVMKITFDPDKDILQIVFIDTTVEETAQIAPGLVLDYDVDGNAIGLELRKASTKVDNPYAISYLVGEANTDKPRPKEKD
jgi:uncharacterized protein YuzE